jgi:hypothetical protein
LTGNFRFQIYLQFAHFETFLFILRGYFPTSFDPLYTEAESMLLNNQNINKSHIW